MNQDIIKCNDSSVSLKWLLEKLVKESHPYASICALSLVFPDCILLTEGPEETIPLFPFFTESLRVVAVVWKPFRHLAKEIGHKVGPLIKLLSLICPFLPLSDIEKTATCPLSSCQS